MAKTKTIDRPPSEAQQDAAELVRLEREKVEAEAGLLAAQKRLVGATNAVVAFRHVVAAREQNRHTAFLDAHPALRQLVADLQARREQLWGEGLADFTVRAVRHAAAGEMDREMGRFRDLAVLAAVNVAEVRLRFGLDKPAQREPVERIFSPLGRAV